MSVTYQSKVTDVYTRYIACLTNIQALGGCPAPASPSSTQCERLVFHCLKHKHQVPFPQSTTSLPRVPQYFSPAVYSRNLHNCPPLLSETCSLLVEDACLDSCIPQRQELDNY